MSYAGAASTAIMAYKKYHKPGEQLLKHLYRNRKRYAKVGTVFSQAAKRARQIRREAKKIYKTEHDKANWPYKRNVNSYTVNDATMNWLNTERLFQINKGDANDERYTTKICAKGLQVKYYFHNKGTTSIVFARIMILEANDEKDPTFKFFKGTSDGTGIDFMDNTTNPLVVANKVHKIFAPLNRKRFKVIRDVRIKMDKANNGNNNDIRFGNIFVKMREKKFTYEEDTFDPLEGGMRPKWWLVYFFQDENGNTGASSSNVESAVQTWEYYCDP